ncbi:hypothetical protein SH668x_002534 [Planctomicrobium sp. SH668]|uniref:hypothetical protein n=1 Tax=Planctomicrobium sp. SH668 TaxID=3448126 RepID=UPI003F5CA01C
MSPTVWLVTGLLVTFTLIFIVAKRFSSPNSTDTAIKQFLKHRSILEQQFLALANRRGIPRDLIWVKCDWQPQVVFARDLQSNSLTAFAAVEIHFEAVPGGEMEDVDAVHYFRVASALFHYNSPTWGTGGKALFNMQPTEAIERMSSQFKQIAILESSSPSELSGDESKNE